MSNIKTTDRSLLDEREAIIEGGLKTFVEVGEALLYIRDNALYQTAAGFKTFELYCKDRWQMNRNHAYRMMDAAKAVSNLSPIGDIPKTESQARPLTKLETPEQQQEAWQVAVEASNGKPTAKHVEAAVEQIQERQEESKSAAKPARYVPCDGLKYAELAILNLEKIQPKDTQRAAAFERVLKWINKNK